MRRLAAVLAPLLAALVLLAAAPAAAPTRPRVTIIGDSVATALSYTSQARTLLGRGVDLRFATAVCRRLVQLSCWYDGSRPATALDVIASARGSLGDVVVVESGYNEYAWQFPDDVDTVMRALVAGGVKVALWLTLHEQRPSYHTMNLAIRAAAARWPQLVVVDWGAYSGNRPWFGDDGIHLDLAGILGMARLLRPYVVEYACGGSCARPRIDA